MNTPEWRRPPARPELTNDQIDIWLADLDAAASNAEKLRPIMSADELDRASRFIRPADRDRYTAGRAILRRLLAQYTNVPAAELTFFYQAKGKPYLAPLASGQNIEFNLSHSGSIALYAFSRTQPIGIDVEQIKATRDLDLIARTILTPAEMTLFAAHDQSERVDLFYRFWTCKEALIKKNGSGLDDVRRIEIPLRPNSNISWLEVKNPDAAMLHEITAIPGYAAALAVAHRSQLRFWRFE